MPSFRFMMDMVVCFNSFSNVYSQFLNHVTCLGKSMAVFAGSNVHKRLITEEAYREKRYEEALKRAFLGTDEDFLACQFRISLSAYSLHLRHQLP